MIARALGGLLGAACAASAPAQVATQPGVQGSQLLDQRSADFALQLRQSQQAVELQRLLPGDERARTEMEALHRDQRRALDNLQGRQRLELELRAQQPPSPATAGADLQYQRERSRAEAQAEAHRFERDLDAQARAAARQQAEQERPRLGPTLER